MPSGVEGVQRHNVNWASRYAKVRYLAANGASTNDSQNAYNQAVSKRGQASLFFRIRIPGIRRFTVATWSMGRGSVPDSTSIQIGGMPW